MLLTGSAGLESSNAQNLSFATGYMLHRVQSSLLRGVDIISTLHINRSRGTGRRGNISQALYSTEVVNKAKGTQGNRYTIAQRVQCLTLQAEDFKWQTIEQRTGIPQRTQSDIKKKAFNRGFRPAVNPVIREDYVIDGAKSGRPVEIDEAKEQEVLAIVRKDRAGREKSSEVIAFEAHISSSSVLRVLKKHNLSSVKPTRKPGLNQAQRAARLKFALDHEAWELEDWKRVIWTDETSVILGQRRGAIRLWRDPHEAYEKSTIRNRFKGFSEFMWWSCFSYDNKGPWHLWKKETAQERKIADKHLEELNVALEPLMRAQWEISTGVQRLRLHGQPQGKKPQWKWNKKNGKLVRDSKGGIDWYRYGNLKVRG